MAKVELKTNGKENLWIGDKIYVVENRPLVSQPQNSEQEVRLRPMCPVCGGTKKIIAKGHNGKEYEITCPNCYIKNRDEAGQKEGLWRQWHLREYIINEVFLYAPETKSKYKKNSIPEAEMSFGAFYTEGQEFFRLKIKAKDQYQINMDYIEGITQYYTKKELAIEKLKKEIATQKKQFIEYNERFETDYEFPFKYSIK